MVFIYSAATAASLMEDMNKQGLFFWLKSVVESGVCPGMTWVDEENGTFRIPWSNQKSRNWQKEDSSVFFEYAKHTCKFKPGDKLDFPKWKQNLKSAINKNRFIERVRHQDCLSSPKPYRVYRFILNNGVRKKCDESICDLGKSMTYQEQSIMEATEGLTNTAVPACERNLSASWSALPFKSVMQDKYLVSDPNLPLSPDLPRGDFCDQPQGNIPTIVCDDNEPGQDNQTSSSVTFDLVSMEEDRAVATDSKFSSKGTHHKTEIIGDAAMEDLNSPLLTGQNNSKSFQPTSIEQPGLEKMSQTAYVTSHKIPEFVASNSSYCIYQNTPHNWGLDGTMSLKTHFNTAVTNSLDSLYLPSKNTNSTGTRVHSGESGSTATPESCSISEMGKFTEHAPDFSSIASPPYLGSQIMTYRQYEGPKATHNANSKAQCGSDGSLMHIEVLYGTPHRTVKRVKITSVNDSCRLFFGSVNCATMQKAIQGYQDAEDIELPAVDKLDYTEKTKATIRELLNQMELGIVISYKNGDIYVERRCLPRVYLSDGVSKSESLPRSTKKRPDVETKAFDFNGTFTLSLEKHKNCGDEPVPKDHFFLTIGYEILPNDESPTRLVPVYIVVRHVLAAQQRFQILGASTIAPNPMFSDPNSFDKTIALFKEIDLKK